MQRVGLLAALAFAVGSCGGSGATAPGAARGANGASRASAGRSGDAGPGEGAPAGPVLASLDDLAARSASIAPGMREEKRQEIDDTMAATIPVARAEKADLCVRVAFVATRAVHAWLEDGASSVLANVPSAADGALGPRGPVCVRRGDSVTFRMESREPARARLLIWASP